MFLTNSLFLSNPMGLWGLLSIPTIFAIYLIQQQVKLHRVSTFFLLPISPVEERRGRRIDTLKNSRSLWFSLLAALLFTWLLSEPRVIRPLTSQRVAIVLDNSFSMTAYRDRALAALDEIVTKTARAALRTEWTLMPSDSRYGITYQGYDNRKLLAAAQLLTADSGTHDIIPQLTLARAFAGNGGLTLFLTDRAAVVPEDVSVIAVGEPFSNAGFIGQRIKQIGSDTEFEVIVRNHSSIDIARTYSINGVESGTLTLPPGGIKRISGRLGESENASELVLEGDRFSLDDRVVVIPRVKKVIKIHIAARDRAYGYFKRAILAEDGAEIVADPAEADAVLGWVTSDEGEAPAHAVVIEPRNTSTAMSRSPIVTDAHILTEGLQFGGMLVPTTRGLELGDDDRVLVWQGTRPLIALRSNGQLSLGFHVLDGNAVRDPALLILLHRYISGIRENSPRFESRSFELSQPLSLPSSGRELKLNIRTLVSGVSSVKTLLQGEAASIRAPAEPAEISVFEGNTRILHGATYFADSREGEFDNATSFDDAAFATKGRLMAGSTGDPLSPLWVLALLASIAGAWISHDGLSRRMTNVFRFS